MNLVGRHGKGESVWLAFFLCHVLGEFAKVASLRNDPSFGDRCETEAMRLRERIEAERLGWANGIDVPTSMTAHHWVPSTTRVSNRFGCAELGVLSGAGDAARVRMRRERGERAHWFRRDQALIQLLDPPFDRSDLEPGYIRGYVPGVREERWSVHPWRDSGPRWHSRLWATVRAPGN